MSVAIAARANHPLDLHDALAARNGRAYRKAQAVVSVMAPCTVIGIPFARFVPALDEIVMHVGR